MNDIVSRLQSIETELRELKQTPLAPKDAWIHTYTITRAYKSGAVYQYTYAKWQAKEAIFGRWPKRMETPWKPKPKGRVKHQYIGRVCSTSGLGMDEEVRQAYEALKRRRRVEALDRAIEEIRKILVHLG